MSATPKTTGTVGAADLIDDARFLTERTRIRHGKLRPYRVAVRTDVRRDHEPPPPADFFRACCSVSDSVAVVVMVATSLPFLFVQVAEDLSDPVLLGNGFVEPELNSGTRPQAQAAADLPAEKRGRPVARARSPAALSRRQAWCRTRVPSEGREKPGRASG